MSAKENDHISHTIKYNNESDLKKAIQAHRTFRVICNKGGQSFIANWLETEIESQGLKCRIYTSKRSALMASSLIPTGVTQVAGIVAAIGIAAHNIATYNPDYEIVKDTIGSDISVYFRK